MDKGVVYIMDEETEYVNEEVLNRLAEQGWNDCNYWQEMKIMKLEQIVLDLEKRIKNLEEIMV